MAAARFYSSTSGLMELQADISAASTTMSVDSTTGLPGTTPFTLVIEPGVTGSEEIVTVTNVGGTTLTITRGVDGTSATAHSAGSEIRHMATARDFREPQEHIGASANVHGVGSGSSVVGTDTEQSLTNKTLVAADADTEGLVVKGASSQSANIFEVQDSAGTELVSVDKDGAATITTSGITGTPLKVTASGTYTRTPEVSVGADGSVSIKQVKQAAAGTVNPALTVKQGWAADGATKPAIVEFYTVGDNKVAEIDAAGAVEVYGNPAGLDPALTIDQTDRLFNADALVVKAPGGTTVAKIDKDGKLTAPAVTTTGNVTVGGDLAVTGDITAGKVELGASMRPQQANPASFTSATPIDYVDRTDASIVFTAPPSGRVWASVGGFVRSTTANQAAYVSPRIRTGGTPGSGTQVVAPGSSNGFGNYGTSFVAGSQRTLVEGLTPGATYNMRLVAKCTDGMVTSALSFGIEPVL